MNAQAAKRRLGLIGLGAVGCHLARRLIERFQTLLVLDTDEEKTARAVALGAIASADPKSLTSQVEVVLLSLPNPAAVSEVMTGPRGLLASAREGTIVLDLSTLDPDSSRAWAGEVAERGGSYLDAPVTCSITPGGGTAAAADGELTFLVGGDRGAFEAVQDVLETLGRRFHYLGSAGSGSVMKLVSNHISGIQTLAIAEALSLAAACGFSAEKTLEVCTDTVADSYVLEAIVKARLDTDKTHFAVELMGKDHRLAQRLAEKHAIELPMNETALALCDRMCEAGYARRDNVASIEYFRKLNKQS